jgi:circadian clock protein KaiC
MRAFAAIRQMRPSVVVIESASACKRMGTAQAAFEYLMRLINTCKEMGITVVATNQTSGYMNLDEISGIGISSLIDTVILLRLVEHTGALRRKLLVMKARGSNHSHRYCDFVITEQGIDIQREDV